MSKSIGNVVDPHELIEQYGVDLIRYFLFREVTFGDDGDFSSSSMQKRFIYDLANDLGNLVQRTLVLIQKIGGRLTVNYNFKDNEQLLFKQSRCLITKMRPLIDKQELSTSIGVVWELVAASNKFVNDTKPWELVKHNDLSSLNAILTVLCESIRSIAFGIAPFMPATATKIFGFINVEGKSFVEMDANFVDQDFNPPQMLFPKE
jgi:methionyl-tRNA synthetase